MRRSAPLCFGGQVLGLLAGERAGACGPAWPRMDPGLQPDGRGLLGMKGLQLYDVSFSPWAQALASWSAGGTPPCRAWAA